MRYALYIEDVNIHSLALFFFQITVLIEVLIPLVLFLVLMSIRFRREPDFVPEGISKLNLLREHYFSLYLASEAKDQLKKLCNTRKIG